MANYRANLVEAKDYLNMQKRGIHSLCGWRRVRSLIIDKQGNTLSQLILKMDEDFDFNYPPALKILESILTIQQ